MMDEHLIKRYIDGKATKEDLRILKSYLSQRDLSELEKWMEKDWKTEEDWSQIFSSERKERLFQQIDAQIQEESREISIEQGKMGKIVPFKLSQNLGRIAIVASILLMVSAGFFYWYSTNKRMISYSTDFAEWKEFTLPDGSLVQLNANSSITFPKNWKEGEDRALWLKGEAFFEVVKKKQTKAKFKVFTEDLIVEVLGTSFNVNSRDSQTDVFLEEGKIKLDLSGGEQEVLAPGEFIAYSSKSRSILTKQQNVAGEEYTSWKEGVLILRDKTGEEIFAKIKEIYGLDIEIARKEILTKKKTVSVPMEKLEIAIPILEGCFKVDISIQGNRLMIQ